MEVLVVEPPGPFRDAVVAGLSSIGASVSVSGDAIDALGRVRALVPDVVLVAESAGPPGAEAVCRIVRRHVPGVRAWPIADARAPEGAEATWLVRADGAAATVSRVLRAARTKG